MEWLFLSCHNYWIVCRLVNRNDGTPFLAYSPNYSIRDSSEPFRAFLGAILSVKERVPVQESVFHPHIDLDVIPEEVDDGPLPEHDIDGGSGEYRDRSRTNVSSRRDPPQTRSRTRAKGSGLMVRLILFLLSWFIHPFVDYFLLPALSRTFPSVGTSSAGTK